MIKWSDRLQTIKALLAKSFSHKYAETLKHVYVSKYCT